ncbi:hypothetical protein [Umezawaea tangerina]|uniref:Uncharacterized protein n=1 Tax=Umezawaea tangerina TaxID=84725 RepID=A0A2T0TL47_9PSEU|nr:hypothetical protein [Umezawaea tangerina]PRY46341.1 hypothetical protein CLV43_101615 [Umezawaea tangerina]
MDEQETGYQLRIMSEEHEKKTGLDLKPAQIAAGALAAVTAAFLGSKLNVAGTISGAAVASVVSTIGGALYQRSIERTRESVRRVGSKAWVVRSVEGVTQVETITGTPPSGVAENTAETEKDTEDKTAEIRRWPRIAAGAVLVFALGMLAVTGVEWVRGEPLSGGSEGTTLGAVVGKPTERRDQPPTPSTSDAPTPTTAPSVTSSAPPTGTSSGAPATTTEPTAPSTSTAPSTGSSSAPAQPGSQTPAPTATEPSPGL